VRRARVAGALFVVLAGAHLGAARDTAVLPVLAALQPPRLAALAGAGAGLVADPGLLAANPAAAPAPPVRSVAFTGGLGALAGAAAGGIGVTWPAAGGTFSAGVATYDGGDLTLVTPDDETVTVAARSEWLLLAGYALPLSGRWAAGVHLKWVHSTLLGEFTADAVAVDAGLQVALNDAYAAGLVVRDAGPAFAWDVDRVAAPWQVRLGLAATAEPEGALRDVLPAGSRFTAVVDGALTQGGRQGETAGGAEVRLGTRVALRGGVRSARDEGLVPAAGVGVTAGRFRLDYAIEFRGRDGARPQSIALQVGW
jgi:hypothetical protein